jgi:hypothetical protein
MATVLKTVKTARSSRVQIPAPPPLFRIRIAQPIRRQSPTNIRGEIGLDCQFDGQIHPGQLEMGKRGRGEGTIYHRSEGRWSATLWLDGRRKALYGRTRAEVQTKLRQLQRDREQGVIVGAPSVTAANYLTRRLDEAARLKVRPKTFNSCSLKRSAPQSPNWPNSSCVAVLQLGRPKAGVRSVPSVLKFWFKP